MITRAPWVAVALLGSLAARGAGGSSVQAPPAAPSSAAIDASIARLGSFDLGARTAAARAIRRTDAAVATPVLTRAARAHADGYVRYRALVLLTGFGDGAARETMHQLLDDPDDRVRAVVDAWFEHHPDPSVLPRLLAALTHERSEFVRPALTRAVAALGTDARARAALVPLVERGQDVFRGAAIAALGDYRAGYALKAITAVVRLDGPLQNDAVIAIGRIGDGGALPVLAELQRSASPDLRPSLAAAQCLLGQACAAAEDYLRQTLVAGVASGRSASMVRAAASGLATLAITGRASALGSLFDLGTTAVDPARSSIALSVGLVALRNRDVLLSALESRADRAPAILLVRDAFDELSSEDYEQERFFADIGRLFRAAGAGTPRRAVAEALMQALEF